MLLGHSSFLGTDPESSMLLAVSRNLLSSSSAETEGVYFAAAATPREKCFSVQAVRNRGTEGGGQGACACRFKVVGVVKAL